jgi:hypothetical protein
MIASNDTSLAAVANGRGLPIRGGAYGYALAAVILISGLLLFAAWQWDIAREGFEGLCRSRLKALALAIQNYHQEFGQLPPVVVRDSGGSPMHSWRVLVLPYLGWDEFYRQYDFSQPWNSAHNMSLARSHPEVAESFHCPCDVDAATHSASYFAIMGSETVWRNGGVLPHEEFDLRLPRILLVEVGHSGVHWMEPRDISYEDATGGLIRSSPHSGFVHFASTDGTSGTLTAGSICHHCQERMNISEWARMPIRVEPDAAR